MDQKEDPQHQHIIIPSPFRASAFDMVSPDNYTKFQYKLAELHTQIDKCLNDFSISPEQRKKIALLKSKLISDTTKQIPLQVIANFTQNILSTDFSHKSLVNMTFQDENRELLIVGRPEVIGSSTKQMRHVTPFAMIKKLIKVQVTNSLDIEQLFESFKGILNDFCKDDMGRVFSKEEISKLNLEKDTQYFKLKTKQHDGSFHEYYLISQPELVRFNIPILEEYNAEYISKKQKYVSYALDVLSKKIIDANSMHIANEMLIRLILVLFNNKPYIAFPEEGNTLNYEIRLYESAENAKSPKLKKYFIIDSSYIKNQISHGKISELDKKIRIVNNEGPMVKKAIRALDLTTSLILKINGIEQVSDQLFTEYNSSFNIPIKTSFPFDFNQSINEKNIAAHIAKHLYIIFDFSPLEEHVFVAKTKGDNLINVYSSATGNRVAKYTIVDGNSYREKQINNAKGYNKEVTFRSEISKQNIPKILQILVIEHFQLFLKIYEDILSTSSYTVDIFQYFTNLICSSFVSVLLSIL